MLPLAAVTCLAIFLALALTLPEGATLTSTQRAVLMPATAAPLPGAAAAPARAGHAVGTAARAATSAATQPVHPAAKAPARHKAAPERAVKRPAAHPRHAKRHVAKRPVRHAKKHVVRHPKKHAAKRPVRHAKRHVVRHAMRHVVRHAKKHVVTHPKRHVVRNRVARPGHVVHGHYLRRLTGGPRDLVRMWQLGAADATRNPAGDSHLVLLDIGGQSPRGVFLSLVNRFISYGDLTAAVSAYVGGYHAYQRRHAPVTIALGTNNDLYTTARSGRMWATQVVNPVRYAARRFKSITIAGADDMEPGFSAGPVHTRAWLRGYLAATKAKFVFNGSADGCSTRHAWSRCNHGWSARVLSLLAGAAAPSRIIALPQIYNRAMAGQWAQISRTAKLSGHRPLHIVGPLTEQAACGRHRNCPSMPSRQAWVLLHRHLQAAGVHTGILPMQVDLDVR